VDVEVTIDNILSSLGRFIGNVLKVELLTNCTSSFAVLFLLFAVIIIFTT
jgi:hypothetical protein